MAEQTITFEAHTRVALKNADAIMAELCEHFLEHGDVTIKGRVGHFEFEFGIATMEADEDSLKLYAKGPDATLLAYIKHGLTEHVIEYARGQKVDIVWQGDNASGRPLPYFREMQVVSARTVTPNMRRVTLRGEGLQRFTYFGVHVRLLIPSADDPRPVWPMMGHDGRPRWGDGVTPPASRVYTIRNIDAVKGEIEIDFVLHDDIHTPGARFGAEARPGDYVGVIGPMGGDLIKADWYLFAGDETALPAIARLLQELPATARAVVRIEVDGAADEQVLTSRASLDVRWLHRDGAAAGTTNLLEDAVRAVSLPVDDEKIYVWVGCEFASFRAIRQYVRKERKLTRDQHLVAAYWRRGFDGDDPRVDHE